MERFGWQRILTSADIDFTVLGDEWLVRFREALPEVESAYSSSGWEYGSDAPWVIVRLRKNQDDLDSCLLIAHSEQPVEFQVAAHSEPDKSFLEVLTRAVDLASQRIGGDSSGHPWTAVLVQSPKSLAPPPERLVANVSIGSLRLEPLNLVFKDPVPVPATGSVLGSNSRIQQSVPIRVYGQTTGYSWQEDASKGAARTLRSLCGLLSLCWEHAYEVAEPAAPLSWGVRQGRNKRPWFRNPIDDRGYIPDWQDHTIPTWLESAWRKLESTPSLSAAVDAFLEARYVEERHPSLAAVAYIASIETVANKLYKLKRCSACYTRLGIAHSFKTAVREVLSEAAAEELDPLYGSRSRTVHNGKLHGGETSPGLLSPGIFSGDTTEEFRGRKLALLSRAAQALITRALLDGLPPQRVLSPSDDGS